MTALMEKMKQSGLAYRSLKDWIEMLGASHFAQWRSFSASWNRLGPDIWMKDGGSYRRRRFATYAVDRTSITRKPHQPHYQSRKFNHLTGGINRWFSPVEPTIGDHELILGLLSAGHDVARQLAGEKDDLWHAEMHQIRIETEGCKLAFPTPEGLHRDGVVLVLMMLVAKANVRGGITSVIDANTGEARKFEFDRPCEGLMIDDRRMLHMVSPITPERRRAIARRDALILTFRPERPTGQSTNDEVGND